VAKEILKTTLNDQAAYYALMKSYIIDKDLQMIFLMAKLGENAQFLDSVYDYSTGEMVFRFFRQWLTSVFDGSAAGQSEAVTMEYTDCKNQISTLTMPQYLLFIDVPVETVRKMLRDDFKIDWKVFEGLGNDSAIFRDRIFALIEAVEDKRKIIDLNALRPFIPIKTQPIYGYYQIDLSDVQQWGVYTDLVSFQLRWNGSNWFTYFTDINKRKTLLLKEGNYYLRVNDKVRQAFIINQQDQRLTAKVK
jgi:hypothetical protein